MAIEDESLKIVPFPKMFNKNDKDYPLCSSLFIGINFDNEKLQEVNLGRAVKDWCLNVAMARGSNKNLNIRIFEA